MDYQSFVDDQKSLLIAPAGYGKTYTIVKCLEFATGRQLILTHTQAGVAAIKEKIKETKISSDRYSVETISSFAQKYVNAFYMGNDIPDQEDNKNYHPFIINKAQILFQSPIIKKIITTTYAGLFVDEYQDCTKSQHQMILSISDTLKTHVLGDPLQGIFNFNGDLVNFDIDLTDFRIFPELSIPYRWNSRDNNRELGNLFHKIKSLLLEEKAIDLSNENVKGLYIEKVLPNDIRNKNSNYRKFLHNIITNIKQRDDLNSLLIIVPEYFENNQKGYLIQKGIIEDRIRIRNLIDYEKSLTLLEAIDSQSFYTLSKDIDVINQSIIRARKQLKKIKKTILEKLFYKTDLDIWFNDENVKNKRDPKEKEKAELLQKIFLQYISHPSSKNMKLIILELKNKLKIRIIREELYYTIIRALELSSSDDILVYEAMKNQRNIIRRSGRKIHGKCIGTTLLTKGLEFDTVVILDAHKFNDPKHFYVAITRCCKNLIIFTEKSILSPYSK